MSTQFSRFFGKLHGSVILKHYLLIFILFERPSDLHTLVHSLNAWSETVGQSQHRDLHLGLPRGSQGPKHLGHQLLPPRVLISRNAGLEVMQSRLESALRSGIQRNRVCVYLTKRITS